MKINTERLKQMIGDASKGALNLAIEPITQLIEVSLNNKTFSLTTTNFINYIIAKASNIEGEDFTVCVNCDLFQKLISKFTTSEIELTLVNGNLHIVGDGTYDIPCAVDDKGTVKIPMFNFDKTNLTPNTLKKEKITSLIALHSSSVSDSPNKRPLQSYFFGDKTITTDAKCFCISDFKLAEGKYSIPQSLFNLVSCMKDENITWYYSNNHFFFESSNYIVFGEEGVGKDKYPEAQCLSLITQKEAFPGKCTIPKVKILQALERISLFTDTLSSDIKPIKITFTDTDISIGVKSSQADEHIPYISADKKVPFTCFANLNNLQLLLNSIPEASFTLYFGNPKLFLFEIKDCWLGNSLVSEKEL